MLSQSGGRDASIVVQGLSPWGSMGNLVDPFPKESPAHCGWWAVSQHNLFGLMVGWQLFKIGPGLHTPLDSFLSHFKSFPWDSLNSSIFLMTNYPSIALEIKPSFCLATSLLIYFPSSWVYVYAAFNGQCIKMPLFIFFSFALLPIMAIIKPLEAGKYLFFFAFQDGLHLCMCVLCRLANMLNFLFYFHSIYMALCQPHIFSHWYMKLSIYTHVCMICRHTYTFTYINICSHTNTYIHKHIHTYTHRKKLAFFQSKWKVWVRDVK